MARMEAADAIARLERGAALPAGVEVDGDLRLTGMAQALSLPDDLVVNGKLVLRSCPGLLALPHGLHVRGAASFRRCQSLRNLPSDLRVDGDLDLAECINLRAIPRDLSACGSLNLRCCASLAALELRELHGDLTLRECTSLRSLPPGLRVHGALSLERCVALRSLPPGLAVGRALSLVNCSQLASLPSDLSVGGDVDLKGCSALRSLPGEMLSWPARPGGGKRNVFVAGAGLAPDALEWLLAARPAGVRLVPGRRRAGANAAAGFESAAAAVAFWAAGDARASALVQAVEAALGPQERDTVRRFLGRLREAKEFGMDETRLALARRVLAVLELVAEDRAAPRVEVLQRMEDSLDACGDKPVWALNQIHLVAEIAKARGDRGALRALGKRVMRLMVVHEHVERKIASLDWVDDVCVYLRFEVELREALDLPVDASAMIFPSYVKIEDAELEAAKDDARGITDAQFDRWLEQWPEWQRQDRLETAEQVRWAALPEAPRHVGHGADGHASFDMVGDRVSDPVQLRGRAGEVWSLADFLRHWVPTGRDLLGATLSPEQVLCDLLRCPLPQ